MIIRKPTQNDILSHLAISSQAFIYPVDKKEIENVKISELICAFDDDNKTMFADMEVNTKFNYFCGNKLRCAAVGGVASKPEYRRKGAVRELFNYLFTEMQKCNRWDISILYPFSNAYYRKFGYETAADVMRLEIPFSELRTLDRFSDVEMFDGTQIDKLLNLYNKISVNNNLAFVRENSDYFFENPHETNNYTYMVKDGETYSAYISYRCNREESIVFVSEIGWTDKKSLISALGFLRVFDTNYDKLVFEKLSYDNPIINILDNEHYVKRSIYDMGAVRILNLKSVLSKKKWPEEYGLFTIQINDILDENRGVFSVEYESGKAVINETPDKGPDVIMDISAASKVILCGVKNLNYLKYLKGIEIHNENPSFFKAFTEQSTFFCDGF